MNNRKRLIDIVKKELYRRIFSMKEGEIAGWKWKIYWIPYRRIGVRIW